MVKGVAKAMTFIPAATAARTPFGESSKTKHSTGDTSSLRAASKYISGSGFGFSASSRVSTRSNDRSRSSARRTWSASFRYDMVARPVRQPASFARRSRLTVWGHWLSRST